MVTLGMPIINIIFKQKAMDFRKRSLKGICAVILKDATVEGESFTYGSMEDVKENWSEENKRFLDLVFKGNPTKVFVEKVGDLTPTLDTALGKLSKKRWHYLCYPNAETLDSTSLVSWIKTKRNTDRRIYKLVGGGLVSPDEKGIINFDTDNVSVDGNTYSKAQFTARICGILAGMPVDISATNYELEEVESFDELASDTLKSESIAQGKLILTNDGERTTIARGVNSKTTSTKDEGDGFKKIRIVDTIDRMFEDILDTVKMHYQGKKVNTYNNKLLLCGDILSYLKELVDQDILSPDTNVMCYINFEKQREYLVGVGIDVEKMTDEQILKANTGDNVFIRVVGEATDVMEDFDFDVTV